MTRPRKEQVCVESTPYYHLTSRCVRRTFLCGIDHTTGKNYEHRRQWIENRIRLLSSLFTVDLCAYAVMSNHYHIAVKLCPEQADNWTDHEVIERWTSLFKGPLLVRRWHAGDPLLAAELAVVSECIACYRERFSSLSWFMKCLNEPMARAANKEDGCTGHFWESRFKSDPLLTETALLSCMVYVDLNPIRACMAETPETSDHTSIQERIAPRFNLTEAIQQQLDQESLSRFEVPIKPLASFDLAVPVPYYYCAFCYAFTVHIYPKFHIHRNLCIAKMKLFHLSLFSVLAYMWPPRGSFQATTHLSKQETLK